MIPNKNIPGMKIIPFRNLAFIRFSVCRICFFFSCILLLISLYEPVYSQNSFSASVDRTTIGLGETFELRFSVATNNPNSVRNFKPPAFSNFFVFSGPNQSTSMQIVNGAMSGSITFGYVLQPKNPGSATIGSASVEVSGKELNSQPISLTIVRTATKPKANAPGPNQPLAQPQETNVDLGQNIFIKATLDKSKAYQGEQINIVFKLYLNGVGISNYSVSKMPSLKGFWSEEFDLGTQVTLANETVNGKQFKVGTIRKLAIFATQSGSLEIDPMELDCILQVRAKRKKSNDIFDNFFGDDPFFNPYTNVQHKVKSLPIKINIEPLPSHNIPASFKGSVGHFNIESSISKTNPKVNEPVTLKVKISGQGNIKLIPTPDVSFPVDLEKYDPKINDNITKGGVISGTRTIEYLFIPRYPGEKKIPPVEFSYFDLEKKNYISLNTPEYKLNVEQGDQPLNASNINREEIKLLGQDINFIKMIPSSFIKKGDYFYKTYTYYLLYLIPLIGMIFALIFRRKIDKDQSDIAGLKFRKANKIAIKRLAKSKKLLDSGKSIGFYDEISRAVWGYFGDKLKIPTASMSVAEVGKNLEDRQISDDICSHTKSCLELCEFARFAPNSETDVEMGKVYEEVRNSIIEIEKTFKPN